MQHRLQQQFAARNSQSGRFTLCFVPLTCAVHRCSSCLQTDQQQQWKEERHTTELQAAQWCEGQVQAVRKEAAEAAVAAEAIVDSRYTLSADRAVVQMHSTKNNQLSAQNFVHPTVTPLMLVEGFVVSLL